MPTTKTSKKHSGELRPFAVHRNRCHPESLVIIARSAHEACQISNLTYGHAGHTKAKSIDETEWYILED